MVNVSNGKLAVICEENGRGLTVIDRQREVNWLLDERTLIFEKAGGSDMISGVPRPLTPVFAEKLNDCTLTVSLKAEEETISFYYSLNEEYIEVRLKTPVSPDIGIISMPGSFSPCRGNMRLLLPIMQGVLWDGRGQAFDWRRPECGHGGFSMAMIGYLAEKGGLLFTAETCDDILWWLGKDDSGRFWAANLQTASLGSMNYDRVTRLYVTDPSITDVSRKYRRKVIEQGNFKNWDEKIAERPSLERLFGTLMCFVGYCRDDIDYARECKKLVNYGFDRALIYPVRFNIYNRDILMGGKPPIDLSPEQVKEIKGLGFDVAPWSWINEALDDGTDRTRLMYRRTAEGSSIPAWKIDDQQWYLCCTAFMEEFHKQAIKGPFSDMTWDHFDVITCATNGECYAMDHPGHPGYPLSRTEDRKWIKRLLAAGRTDGRILSSEGFNDAYAGDYDLGSVKMWPQYGNWPFWPVPLSMLVYHDSMIHSWWELHSYNNPWHGNVRELKMYQYGGGRPRLMAALDALMGCPPDVFPFGSQYMWTGRGQETFAYRYRFEDHEVQIALKEALPVAKLHRRIGKQEMVGFEILSEDGYVQQSVFADGTRVVANFCNQVRGDIPGIEPIQGESWKISL